MECLLWISELYLIAFADRAGLPLCWVGRLRGSSLPYYFPLLLKYLIDNSSSYSDLIENLR
jgi:hypothetical protein